MGCQTLSISTAPQAVLSITPVDDDKLTVQPTAGATLTVQSEEDVALQVKTTDKPVLSVTPQDDCVLTIVEVCSVSERSIVVLAALDGPLFTIDGEYLLLDPATNPPKR